MKFVFEKYLTDRNNVVCVDGLFESKLQISHWRGNITPKEFKDDTTTQMAFKFIESIHKNDFLQGIEVVSNNHFDTDGLLSAFVFIHPDLALQNKRSLINTSITGDFAEFTTEDDLKTNIVIESLFNLDKSLIRPLLINKSYPEIIQILYDKGFEIIPELLNNIDKYEQFWIEEFRDYEKSQESFVTQNSVFSNYSDCKLSVIESTIPLYRVSKYQNAENDIVLSVIKSSNGNKYELEYKLHTWFDTTRNMKIKRKDLNSLSEKLNLIENNPTGKWQVYGREPLLDWDYRLVFADERFKLIPSKITLYEVENLVFDYFLEI